MHSETHLAVFFSSGFGDFAQLVIHLAPLGLALLLFLFSFSFIFRYGIALMVESLQCILKFLQYPLLFSSTNVEG